MHRVLITIGLLMLVAGAACTVDPPGSGAADAKAIQPVEADNGVRWRRTAIGWERADLWPTWEGCRSVHPVEPPRIHPIFIAGAILAISVASLSSLNR
jgi:hypothetical protein